MKRHLWGRRPPPPGPSGQLTSEQKDAILRANEILTASEQGDSETMARTFAAAIEDGTWPSVVSGLCSISKGLATQLELVTGKDAERWRLAMVHGVVLAETRDQQPGPNAASPTDIAPTDTAQTP